jgi:5-methylcytosine-specific restriction enzyme A
MAKIQKIAFKEITGAEFLAINTKTKGSGKGGGQSYIDFHPSYIPESTWASFFSGLATTKNAPRGWIFDVHSLGVSEPPQSQIELSYRDKEMTRFGLRSQKHPDLSSKSRRLYAWRPQMTGFPELPQGITSVGQIPPSLLDNVRIFLIRDDEGHIWASWRRGAAPASLPAVLAPMFAEPQGMIQVSNALDLDPGEPQWPFREPLVSDGPGWDPDDELLVPDAQITYSLQKVRARDKAAANSVRQLYTTCQISGAEFLFTTKSGRPYLEVHHLIPLGKGGADSAHNMVVVSAHVHKMLHYAEVSPIDLSQVANNQLPITIAGHSYTIKWHPQHVLRVLEHNQP